MAVSGESIRWWREARFGMFIHWGLYAVPAGTWKGWQTDHIGEWIMYHARIPVAEYEKLAERFNPVRFDAREWVRVAKEAGMKYIVITSKHHDGFALYHSRCSAYNIVDATPYGKDPIADLAEACREAGLKLGFYYSQVQDWHEKDAVGNDWDWPDESEKDFARYLEEKCKPQIRELLTQYGEIGLIWFDTPKDCLPEHSQQLFDLVKELQPNCIVNGRIGNQRGDYISTGDNMIPALPLDKDWEVPATLNDTWGFKSFDKNWKSSVELIRLLVTINSRGGNYLLNVGPTAEGIIPKPSVDILLEVGQWMERNGESIYGTKATPVFPYDYSQWGGITSKPGRIYLHLFELPKRLGIHGLANRVTGMRFLADPGRQLDFEQQNVSSLKQHRLQIQMPDKAPDPVDSVIAVDIDGDRVVLESLDNL